MTKVSFIRVQDQTASSCLGNTQKIDMIYFQMTVYGSNWITQHCPSVSYSWIQKFKGKIVHLAIDKR